MGTVSSYWAPGEARNRRAFVRACGREGRRDCRCVLVAACTRAQPDTRATARAVRAPLVVATRAERAPSNIARADYVGPEACGECHADAVRALVARACTA